MSLTRLYYPLCRTRFGHCLAKRAVRAMRRAGIKREFCLPLDALDLPHEDAAGLMKLWPRIHWAGGDGMMPPKQLLAIYKLAATWPGEGDIVELGAWVGLTTCYLATASRVRGRGVVHAVDTFQGTREGGRRYRSVERHGGNTYDAFCDNIAKAGLSPWVQAHRGLTTEVANRYDGQPIRLLLVDADHSYEGVLADIASWSPHMAAGGLIVFHDYLMSDVARAVDETILHDTSISASPGSVDPNIMAVTWAGQNDAVMRGRGNAETPHPRVPASPRPRVVLSGAEVVTQ